MIKHLLAPDFHLANTYWLPVPQESLLLSKSPLCNLMDLLNPPATGRWAYQMPFCSQK